MTDLPEEYLERERVYQEKAAKLQRVENLASLLDVPVHVRWDYNPKPVCLQGWQQDCVVVLELVPRRFWFARWQPVGVFGTHGEAHNFIRSLSKPRRGHSKRYEIHTVGRPGSIQCSSIEDSVTVYPERRG